MGKIQSLLLRPIRTFNIENRAERVISKEKPVPAPQYSSVKKQKEIMDKLHPDFNETYGKKDPKLDTYLKSIFVQSNDPKSISEEETLSSKDQSPLDAIYGTSDNVTLRKIAKNKCRLQDIVEFLTMHQQNPEQYSIDKISQQYQLDEQLVENIIKNFKVLYYVSKEEKT